MSIANWAPIEARLNEKNQLINNSRESFYSYLNERLGKRQAIEVMMDMKVGRPFWERALNILDAL